MTGDPAARSTLEERSADLETIGARLLPFLSQIDLRVDPADTDRCPYPLPFEPNTSTEHEGVDVLWLGPDEWLLEGPPGAGREMISTLETASWDAERSIVDVSANRVAIELGSGDRLELLSHVCPLDLEPPAWVAGLCAQTLVGRAQALLHERGDATRLFVRPSFAGYVVDLLLEVRRVTGDVKT